MYNHMRRRCTTTTTKLLTTHRSVVGNMGFTHPYATLNEQFFVDENNLTKLAHIVGALTNGRFLEWRFVCLHVVLSTPLPAEKFLANAHSIAVRKIFCTRKITLNKLGFSVQSLD